MCVYHSQWPVKDPGSDLNTDSLLRVVGVLFQVKYAHMRGFPGSLAGKESTCNAGDPWFASWVRKIS